jgi:hypothetical protein
MGWAKKIPAATAAARTMIKIRQMQPTGTKGCRVGAKGLDHACAPHLSPTNCCSWFQELESRKQERKIPVRGFYSEAANKNVRSNK